MSTVEVTTMPGMQSDAAEMFMQLVLSGEQSEGDQCTADDPNESQEDARPLWPRRDRLLQSAPSRFPGTAR